MNDPDDIAPLFAPAGHFYSPVTHQKAVRRYLASDHYLRQIAHTDALIDLHAMTALWRRFEKDIISFPFEPSDDFRYYGRNSQFEYYDASILSGLLAAFNPRQIIEIGAGFSSAAIFDTIDRMTGARLEKFTTIDPDLSRIKMLSPPPSAELIAKEVQTIPLERFEELERDDVLFIDSSHVMKTGSDVHYEYLHILPKLRPGVIVHIHDIFYPLDYPRRWAAKENRSWNEVYMVDMMLTFGNAFEILFFNDAFLTKVAGSVRQAGDMFDRFENFPHRATHRINGSLWLRKT